MIITIDEGTTSTRALLIDSKGKILFTEQEELDQYYPKPGWVEHDANQIWIKSLGCARKLIKKTLQAGIATKDDFEGIAITNQRETTIVWDPKTGKAVHKAIVWQCRRTADYCKKIEEDLIKGNNLKDYVKVKTGLQIDAYFSATKIKWLLDNACQDIDLEKLAPGELMFGTVDTWLIWNLTLGREFSTDTTNASRTMLYDIHENKWDENLLEYFKIPKEILPEVKASNADFNSSPLFQDLLDKELPIKAVMGDQQAALYAYNNEAKITYGTGTFVLIPGKEKKKSDIPQGSFTETIAGEKADIIASERESVFIESDESNKGLVESIAFTKENNDIYQAYGLEGSIFIGGSIVQWLRDELNFIESAAEIEELANKVEDNGGVYLIPALAGLGAPFWRGDLRGSIFGITRGTNRSHIARAALESIAYRVCDVFEALDPEIKASIKAINVDGGASKNDTLLQFQADLLNLPVRRYKESEMTALGTAKMTGDVDLKLELDKEFKPKNDLSHFYDEWQRYLTLLTQ
jgi:glycerol kinase